MINRSCKAVRRYFIDVPTGTNFLGVGPISVATFMANRTIIMKYFFNASALLFNSITIIQSGNFYGGRIAIVYSLMFFSSD